jgi:hypothetical protein
MKPTLKFATTLLSFSLQGCEDMDDTAADKPRSPGFYMERTKPILFMATRCLTYLMIVLHHKIN